MLYLIAFYSKHPSQREDIDKMVGKFDMRPISPFCYLIASERHPSEIFYMFEKIRAKSPFYIFSLSNPFDGEGDYVEGYNTDAIELKSWISEHI